MNKYKRRVFLLIVAILCVSTYKITHIKLVDKNINKDENEIVPITLTMFSTDLLNDMKFDDDVAKKITELTGVKLKFMHPVAGDTQAIPLMISTGEYPDLIYAKGDIDKLIDAKAIIPLDEYIERSGDNLKKLYGDKLDRLRCSEEDPSIYTVGTYGISTEIFNPNGSMQLQHAVLKDLGYPKIKTLQDYEKAIKDYMTKYPEINGHKTIGVTLMASDWNWIRTCGNIAGYVAGIPDDGQFKVDDETGEAVYKFELPEVKEYFKWLNHINAEGLLDPESFTQKADTYIKKLSQGNVIGISDSQYNYEAATKTLISLGLEERTYSPVSVTLSDKYKDQTMKEYAFSGGWGVSISSTSKHKDIAFKFLDWLASDEAQVLLNWGIEGKHYKVENGKRKLLKEVQKQKNIDKDFINKTGVGKYVYPFPQRGSGAVDKNGDTYTINTLENYIENYNSAEKETLEAYGIKTWLDMFPSKEELGVSRHGQVWQYNISSDSEMAIIQNEADDYVQRSIIQAILGSEDDFDSLWNNIQMHLKQINIDKLNNGMTELVKEKLKLWNK